MSFWGILNLSEKKECLKRKEQDSDYMHSTHYFKTPSHKSPKGTSVSIGAKGSVTVEAALAVPIFFFTILCMIYLIEILAIQIHFQSGITYAGKQFAQEISVHNAIRTEAIEEAIIKAVGKERIENSIIVGGSSGISCEKTKISLFTKIIDIHLEYKVRIPIPGFTNMGITCTLSQRVKGWTGFANTNLTEAFREETIVYITEHGLVYHEDYSCTHLDLSVKGVAAAGITGLRNEGGGKYHACERCIRGGSAVTEVLYITDTGSRYHSGRECSGIKREVIAVPITEVLSRRGCSRCTK